MCLETQKTLLTWHLRNAGTVKIFEDTWRSSKCILQGPLRTRGGVLLFGHKIFLLCQIVHPHWWYYFSSLEDGILLEELGYLECFFRVSCPILSLLPGVHEVTSFTHYTSFAS
jgi:hypothetical protein